MRLQMLSIPLDDDFAVVHVSRPELAMKYVMTELMIVVG